MRGLYAIKTPGSLVGDAVYYWLAGRHKAASLEVPDAERGGQLPCVSCTEQVMCSILSM